MPPPALLLLLVLLVQLPMTELIMPVAILITRIR